MDMDLQNRQERALAPLFRRIEVRDKLSDEERHALLEAAGDFRIYEPGATIVEHGSVPDVCTLLTRGFACRFNITEDGGRQISSVHVTGDFIDLHSLPLRRMDHNIGALGAVEVLLFPHRALLSITERFPHLTRLLWMLTLLDGAIHRRWIVAMGQLPALGQMAHFICEIYLRLEAVGLARDSRLDFPLTQVELADVLGISSVHANRVLQELRSKKLVIWEDRVIQILNWRGLSETAMFTDEFLFSENLPR